jgi:hypothetical protein
MIEIMGMPREFGLIRVHMNKQNMNFEKVACSWQHFHTAKTRAGRSLRSLQLRAENRMQKDAKR